MSLRWGSNEAPSHMAWKRGLFGVSGAPPPSFHRKQPPSWPMGKWPALSPDLFLDRAAEAGNMVTERHKKCDDEDEPPWHTPLTDTCSLAGPRRTLFKHQHAGALRRPQAHVRPLPATIKRWSRCCRSRFEQLRWAGCLSSRRVTEALLHD